MFLSPIGNESHGKQGGHTVRIRGTFLSGIKRFIWNFAQLHITIYLHLDP